mmetsp:Transcript_12755/g.35284  ORF Transcript_12755/g.35284 Transcript_12755/m.35284 type:complete len:390 (-) Transcript_12755:71-1240(-)
MGLVCQQRTAGLWRCRWQSLGTPGQPCLYSNASGRVQWLNVQRSDVPSAELAIRQPVELSLDFPGLHILQPAVVSTGLHLLLELLRVGKLHGTQVRGQLVLPPHDLAPLLALDDTVARSTDSRDHAPDFLPESLTLLRELLLVLVILDLPLHHPLRRCRMPRAEVLRHSGARPDRVALQPFARGVRRFLVAIPEDDRARHRGHLLCLARRAKRHLREGQELQTHDRIRVQTEALVELAQRLLRVLHGNVRDVNRGVDHPRLVGVALGALALDNVICVRVGVDHRLLQRELHAPSLRLPLGVLPDLERQDHTRLRLGGQVVVPEEPQALVGLEFQRGPLSILCAEDRADEAEILRRVEDLELPLRVCHESLRADGARDQSIVARHLLCRV